MIALGFLAALGNFFLIKAFQMAPASALMPFTYSSLIWALIFGYWFFNELPDQQTVLGSVIIIGSGLYIYIREKRKI
jgi:drug/metabolite transporter (DMT)-like permease